MSSKIKKYEVARSKHRSAESRVDVEPQSLIKVLST